MTEKDVMTSCWALKRRNEKRGQTRGEKRADVAYIL